MPKSSPRFQRNHDLSFKPESPDTAELVPGTWAQRCDVLRAGDVVVGINGVSTATMTQRDIAQLLERSDRVQLEVRYPLPPRPPSRNRFRSKIIQVRRIR